MSDESLSELQREWRQRITNDIEGIRKTLDELTRQLAAHREEFVRQRDHDALEIRVKSLEADKQKFMGAIVVVNIIGGLILWAIGKFWK